MPSTKPRASEAKRGEAHRGDIPGGGARGATITVHCSDGSVVELASWKLMLLPRTPVEVSLIKRFQITVSASDRFVFAATQLMVLTYTFLASIALEPLNCVAQPDGTYLLKASADVKCYDHVYNSYLTLITLAVVVYVIGIPVVILWILIYARARGQLGTPHFDFMHGSLTMPYTLRSWYFELVNTARKLAIVVVVQYLGRNGTPDSTLSQIMVAMTVISAFAFLQVFESPYTWNGNGTLSLFTTLSLLFVLFSGLLFFTQRLSAAAIGYVAAVTVIVVAASAAVSVYTFLAEYARAAKRSSTCRALGLNRYQLHAMEQRLLERMFPHAGEMLMRELAQMDEGDRDLFIADCFQLLRLVPSEGGLDPYRALRSAQAASLGQGAAGAAVTATGAVAGRASAGAGGAGKVAAQPLPNMRSSRAAATAPVLPPPSVPPPPLPLPPPLGASAGVGAGPAREPEQRLAVLWTGRQMEVVSLSENRMPRTRMP
jgi:hypothetical protein